MVKWKENDTWPSTMFGNKKSEKSECCSYIMGQLRDFLQMIMVKMSLFDSHQKETPSCLRREQCLLCAPGPLAMDAMDESDKCL